MGLGFETKNLKETRLVGTPITKQRIKVAPRQTSAVPLIFSGVL